MLVVLGSRWWAVKSVASAIPYWDQWSAEAELLYLLPWLEHRLDPAVFVAPHNEHRVALTRLYSLALLEANGQWDPRLQMTVNALIAAAIAVFLGVLLSRIFGSRRENVILLAIAVLWSLPFGFASTAAGFHSSWYFLILFTLVSLWGLLLKPNFSVGWWLGALAAPLGIFTMASGFVAGSVVMVIKGWQMIVEPQACRAHLPSLLVGAATCPSEGLLLVHSPEHHAQLRATTASGGLRRGARKKPGVAVVRNALVCVDPVSARGTLRFRGGPQSPKIDIRAPDGRWIWRLGRRASRRSRVRAGAAPRRVASHGHPDHRRAGKPIGGSMLLADNHGPAFCRGQRGAVAGGGYGRLH